ncbi:hypothetical protein MMC17_002107 [Xylographa soralifera]|nr:hypothetical protein [Xylographa soralifera]
MSPKDMFLGLPLELRCMIYKLVYTPLIDDYGNLQVVCIKDDCYTDGLQCVHQCKSQRRWGSKLFCPQYATRVAGRFETSLLYVCHQISVEAAPFLYSQQVFSLPSPDLTHEWMDSIGKENLSHIRHVVISSSNDLLVGLEDTMAGAWAEIIELMPCLKTMTVLQAELLRKPNRNRDRTGEAFLLREGEHAISSLHRLAFLRLASHHCSLQFLKIKLNLTTLILKPLFFGMEDWDDAFAHLPSLKNLFLDLSEVREQNLALFPEHFLGNIAPLRSFGWKGQRLPEAVAMHLKLRHGATLRELHLEHEIAAVYERDPAALWIFRIAPLKYASPSEYQTLVDLLRHLPALTALRLKYHCPSSILCDLPFGLRQLDIAFVEPNHRRLWHNTQKLLLQCPSLDQLRLMDNHPETAHHEAREFWTHSTRNGRARAQLYREPKCHCVRSLHYLRDHIPEVVLSLCVRPAREAGPLRWDGICHDRRCPDRVATAYEDDWARFPMVGPHGGRVWKEFTCREPGRPAYVPEGKGELVVPVLETGRPDEPSVWGDYFDNTASSVDLGHAICSYGGFSYSC